MQTQTAPAGTEEVVGMSQVSVSTVTSKDGEGFDSSTPSCLQDTPPHTEQGQTPEQNLSGRA